MIVWLEEPWVWASSARLGVGDIAKRRNVGREGRANTIAVRSFRPPASPVYVSVPMMSHTQAVVDELRQGCNEVRCAFSSGPEREWTLD